MFRRRPELEVLVAHPGGPYFARKDEGAWTIPKGLIEEGEDPLLAARREFREEVGHDVSGPFIDLGEVRLKSGKRIRAFAAEGDLDEDKLVSNTFEIEWPRGSGRMQRFPEIDRVSWFAPQFAARKLNAGQGALIERLGQKLASGGDI